MRTALTARADGTSRACGARGATSGAGRAGGASIAGCADRASGTDACGGRDDVKQARDRHCELVPGHGPVATEGTIGVTDDNALVNQGLHGIVRPVIKRHCLCGVALCEARANDRDSDNDRQQELRHGVLLYPPLCDPAGKPAAFPAERSHPESKDVCDWRRMGRVSLFPRPYQNAVRVPYPTSVAHPLPRPRVPPLNGRYRTMERMKYRVAKTPEGISTDVGLYHKGTQPVNVPNELEYPPTSLVSPNAGAVFRPPRRRRPQPEEPSRAPARPR